MKVIIESVPHGEQRLKVNVGDWKFLPDGSLHIRVSEFEDKKHEVLVAVHEFVEAMLCLQHGVHEHDVDAFDAAYQGDGEPGNHSDAPYRAEHLSATMLECALAAQMGVDWKAYDKACDALVTGERQV